MVFPGSVKYSLQSSQDFRDLFNVNVEYKNADGSMSSAVVKYGNWTVSMSNSDDFEPEMTVSFTSRNKELTAESYDMVLLPDITVTTSQKPSFKKDLTRAESQETFSFKVPKGTDDLSIRIAPLKYDKHFVFCFTVDDSYVNGWSRIFALINGRWIDDTEFFHEGVERTTGYYPEHPLCITDGCGNDRRFTFGEAIWPNCWNNYNPKGLIQDNITSIYNPYISWSELQVMTDLGNAVYWHNVDSAKYDQTLPDEIVQGLAADYEKTFAKIGYPMKTLAQPDGNPNYLLAAAKSPLVYLSRCTHTSEGLHLSHCGSMYKMEVYGGTADYSIDKKLAELAEQAAADDPILISLLAHRPGDDYMAFLNTLYDLYGKGGADNLWMTSYDELYEYIELRTRAVITHHTEGTYEQYDVSVPIDEKFLFDELSFIVEGATGKAEPVSANLYGFSSALQDDGALLVNCGFGDRNKVLAEKYIERYAEGYVSDYKEYAEYLISLLREDLRPSLLDQLGDVTEPSQEDFPLNGVYTRRQMEWYLQFYDGYSFTITPEDK